MKFRLDQKLLEWGWVPSRSKAKELILARKVEVFRRGQWEIVEDPGFNISGFEEKNLRILDRSLLQFVSRGGLKLEAALRHWEISVQACYCLDVGQSTGGFTDCLLQFGAQLVVGVDVGRDQLDSSLRQNKKVIFFEQVNARNLETFAELQVFKGSFDWVVGDLSFISTDKVFPALGSFLKPGGRLLFLIKPQFELGRGHLNKKGIVKGERGFPDVKQKVEDTLLALNFKVLDYWECPVVGQEGNREFFIYAQK